MSAVRVVVVVFCVLAGAAARVEGQVYSGGDAPDRGSIEVGGGGNWGPGFETGRTIAELTRGGQSDGFDLFTSEEDVSGFPGLHAWLGFYLSRALSLEGGVRFSKPELAYRLSGDAESAPDETAAETLSSYVFEGSALFHFTQAAFAGGRGIPFVSGGGGYIRELHESNQLVETGNEIHVTGGFKYWFGSGDHRFGLRAEAGISSREQGFDKEEGRRTLPLVLFGAAFLF